MFSGALNDLKNCVVDGFTKQLVEKINEITDGAVNCESILENGQIIVDGNSYVDKILTKVSSKLESTGITQLELPNHNVEFQKDVMCGLVFPGDIDFQKGIISGITSITRMDDTHLKLNILENPIVLIESKIGIVEALVNYLADIKFLCLTQDQTKLSGGLKDICLLIKISISSDLKINLDQFEINSTGCFNLGGIETLGFFDFLKDKISEDMEQTIKESIKKFLQNTIHGYIKDVIGETSI